MPLERADETARCSVTSPAKGRRTHCRSRETCLITWIGSQRDILSRGATDKPRRIADELSKRGVPELPIELKRAVEGLLELHDLVSTAPARPLLGVSCRVGRGG
jgi:hypothetical protein